MLSWHCAALHLRASSTQDIGALCFSMAKVGSTDSMALGTGSLSSTKLLTAPGDRLSSCTGNVRSMSYVWQVHQALCLITAISEQHGQGHWSLSSTKLLAAPGGRLGSCTDTTIARGL